MLRFWAFFVLVVCAVNLSAFPIVTDVNSSGFFGVEDLAFRQHLQKLPLVNFEHYPQLEPVYQNIIALAENLLIEEDGHRPIKLVFVDDMRPNAAFIATVKGDRAIIFHLGLLKLMDNDDQIAFVLGHELEHGLSVLNEKVSTRAAGRYYEGHYGGVARLRAHEPCR